MSEKQLIISVSREYGSGGHVIAEALAKEFNLPLYDQNILVEIAAGRNVDADVLKRYDERPKKLFFSATVKGYSNSPEENIANMQFDFLRERAKQGESFVIVGRCAEWVLHESEALISFFVLGDKEAKTSRIMERENLSEAEAKELIRRIDKKRKSYHNYYCKGKWGDSRWYDMTINSSRLGISGTAEIMEQYIRMRLEEGGERKDG